MGSRRRRRPKTKKADYWPWVWSRYRAKWVPKEKGSVERRDQRGLACRVKA